MFKNQLQELAQRSCFNLPSYACIREGPDHAPRFKASVNFNGEIFESPLYCSTLRQAEHAAAEVALNSLSARGPSKSLTARVLDETGVYKNLLQETAHRAGLKLPLYSTVRSGPGHIPVFTSTVEIAGMCFSGEAAKTKKQAEKNAAISAWSSLKTMPNLGPLLNSKELEHHHENRVIRRRDYQYQRGRMQRPQSQKRPWKFTDTFSEPISEKCVQSRNNFLNLLPPPPPRTTPRILPPNLVPSKTMGSSEAQEDENYEWIYKISEAIKKHKEGKSQAASGALKMVGNSKAVEEDYEPVNKATEASKKAAEAVKVCTSWYSSHFHGGKSEDDKKALEGRKSDIVDFSKSSSSMLAFQSSCSNQIMNGGQRFAPAVQMRSVIPVCAAPPPPKEAAAAAEVASTLGKLKL